LGGIRQVSRAGFWSRFFDIPILSSSFGSKTWNGVLANRCTVIIAEALNGKTTEMQQRTHARRKAGVPGPEQQRQCDPPYS